MTDNWASMPLVEGSDPGDIGYKARPKYRVDADIVIHQGDSAYVPLNSDLRDRELLEYSDVHVLSDDEVEKLEEQLPYPLPSQSTRTSLHAGNESGQVGLGDLVAQVTHKLGITECASCKKRRRWLNRISVGWRQGE